MHQTSLLHETCCSTMSSGTAHAHGEHTQTSVRHTPGGVSVSASAHSSGNGPMRHETTTSSSPPGDPSVIGIDQGRHDHGSHMSPGSGYEFVEVTSRGLPTSPRCKINADFHGMSLHDLCAWLRERNIDYHTAIERGDLEELARNASSG